MGAGGGGGREECHAGRTMHRALWYAAMEADGTLYHSTLRLGQLVNPTK